MMNNKNVIKLSCCVMHQNTRSSSSLSRTQTIISAVFQPSCASLCIYIHLLTTLNSLCIFRSKFCFFQNIRTVIICSLSQFFSLLNTECSVSAHHTPTGRLSKKQSSQNFPGTSLNDSFAPVHCLSLQPSPSRSQAALTLD